MPCPNHRRKRTISKAFRVSREESERIELLARAAGVTQQEYIMTAIEGATFTIESDIRTYKVLRDEMRAVYAELCRIREGSQIDERLIAKVELLSDLFDGLNDVSTGLASPIGEEDDLIADMGRG